ncbi:malonate decarboxylase acyl carrier protein [Brucella intermedia]|uniref:malonate decarboxylase acyl carrier protein n=1 Tax=Brucella intermedia TaxID=94625 RepID=UPI00224AFC82|nr:malonate decarboxylase acyl carrier protein [Brucella intermedia]
MEKLEFAFSGSRLMAASNKPVIAGVLGSGNLEVLIEPARDLPGICRIEVETAAVGFGTIWQRVLEDVMARWQVGNMRISINDAGATPAVVALRLDQALKTFTGSMPGARP